MASASLRQGRRRRIAPRAGASTRALDRRGSGNRQTRLRPPVLAVRVIVIDVTSVLQKNAMTMTRQGLEVLPATSAGQRAAWVWQRVLAKAAGAAAPDRREFEEHYGQEWLDEVPMEESLPQKSEMLDGRIRASLGQMKEPRPARAQSLGRHSSNRLGPLHPASVSTWISSHADPADLVAKIQDPSLAQPECLGLNARRRVRNAGSRSES